MLSIHNQADVLIGAVDEAATQGQRSVSEVRRLGHQGRGNHSYSRQKKRFYSREANFRSCDSPAYLHCPNTSDRRNRVSGSGDVLAAAGPQRTHSAAANGEWQGGARAAGNAAAGDDCVMIEVASCWRRMSRRRPSPWKRMAV